MKLLGANDEKDGQGDDKALLSAKQVNYGLGIRTVRLINDQLTDLEDLRQKEEEAEEEILEIEAEEAAQE